MAMRQRDSLDVPTATYLAAALLAAHANRGLRFEHNGYCHDGSPIGVRNDPYAAYLVASVITLAVRLVAGKGQAAAVAYVALLAALWQRIALLLLILPGESEQHNNDANGPEAGWIIWGWLNDCLSSIGPIDVLAMSIVQLSGVMLGHELLHRRGVSRLWPCLVLGPSGYAPYVWEHVHHHRNAGTDLDPASTVRGTSVYRFIAERYPTHLRSAARHCPTVLAATTAAFVLFVGAFAMVFSVSAAATLVSATLWHWFLVDAGTYTSHYGVVGLPRRRSVDNDGEDSNIAWDGHMTEVAAPFFFGIEKHVDHHRRPHRPAAELDYRGNLRYPVRLEVAIITAFIPPLWFHMTDPILDGVLEAGMSDETANTQGEGYQLNGPLESNGGTAYNRRSQSKGTHQGFQHRSSR